MAGMVEGFTTFGGGDLTQVSDVSLGERLAQVPQLEGLVDELVAGIYAAFSLAIANTFWVGLAVTLVALVVVTFGLQDKPISHVGGDEASDGEVVPPAVA